MPEAPAPGAPALERIQLASLSDAGRVRADNQDAVVELSNTSGERLLIVADGMGGHRGGETAAKICVQILERNFRDPHGAPDERLRRGLELGNEEVYSHALSNSDLRGMGTTVVAVLFSPIGGHWLAWVGDSRCYRLRGGELSALTRDHSLMTEWIALGVLSAAAAETHPRRHELTRALGQAPDVNVEIVPLEVRAGDAFLLCSDGLHGSVPERGIKSALSGAAPADAVRALVERANANGGPDNISVIVAAFPAERTWSAESAPTIPLEPPPVQPASSETPTPPPVVSAPIPAEPAPPAAESAPPTPPPTPTEPPSATPDRVAPAEPLALPVAAATPEPAAPLADPDELSNEMMGEFLAGPGPDEPEPAAPALAGPPPELDFALDTDLSTPEVEPPPAATAPGPAPTLQAEVEPSLAEESFADLDDDIAGVVAEHAPAPEAGAVAAPSDPFSAALSAPAPSAPIHIPLMTPVRARSGLDLLSLIAGIGGTLLLVALGIGAWLYLRSPEAVVERPAPIPRAHAPRPRPAPAPPAALPAPAPAHVRPQIEPVFVPPHSRLREVAPSELAQTPSAAAPAPTAPVPAASATVPAPAPSTAPAPAATTARAEPPRTAPPAAPAPEQAAAKPLPSAQGFELPADVRSFVDDWLRALAQHDHARFAALGFREAPAAFAKQWGAREDFRLVAAGIDEERSSPGRIYLRIVVSYAFQDAAGRFRTQDEERMILRSSAGRLRFEGRWQQ